VLPEEHLLGKRLLQLFAQGDERRQGVLVVLLAVAGASRFLDEAGVFLAVRRGAQQVALLGGVADFLQRRPGERLDAPVEQLPVDPLVDALDP
jgi:hypothetical protein